MSNTIMLRVIAGVLAAIVLAVIVFRRKKSV
jgi:LPXTG-motif cell wall-anchored protein